MSGTVPISAGRVVIWAFQMLRASSYPVSVGHRTGPRSAALKSVTVAASRGIVSPVRVVTARGTIGAPPYVMDQGWQGDSKCTLYHTVRRIQAQLLADMFYVQATYTGKAGDKVVVDVEGDGPS